jgi:biopolymer transport protein ExbB/TolQ
VELRDKTWAPIIIIAISILAGLLLVLILRSGGVGLFKQAGDEEFRLKTVEVPVDQERDVQSASEDPTGYNLSHKVAGYYRWIVFFVYWALASMTFTIFLRLIYFLYRFIGTGKHYPKRDEIAGFKPGVSGGSSEMEVWDDFASQVAKKDDLHFWSTLSDALASTTSRKERRFDLIFYHFKRGVERLANDLAPTTLYHTLASASPAVGFFGTLLGMLYIFGAGDTSTTRLASTPTFAVGLRVAIVTSLWGLFNLTLAVTFEFIINFASNRRTEAASDRAKSLIEVYENLALPAATAAGKERDDGQE